MKITKIQIIALLAFCILIQRCFAYCPNTAGAADDCNGGCMICDQWVAINEGSSCSCTHYDAYATVNCTQGYGPYWSIYSHINCDTVTTAGKCSNGLCVGTPGTPHTLIHL